MNRQRSALLTIFIVLCVFLCMGADAETILRRGSGAEPGTLDPHARTTNTQARIGLDLYEGLTSFAPGGKISPGQAQSWVSSADGRIWTFTLRPGLKWSNGDPLTAEDFVYSLRRLVNPANAFRDSAMLEPILNAAAIVKGTEKDLAKLGVTAPDERTVQITLERANLALPEILAAVWPVHRASIEALGTGAFKPGQLISNGAYRLTEWRPQAVVALEKNPAYWDAEHVNIDRVEFYPIEQASEELKLYRAGGLDVTYDVPPNQIEFIKRTYGQEFKQSPALGNYVIGFNNSRPPFKDNLKLREALTLAIDRQKLADKITHGRFGPAYGWVPKVFENYANASFPGAELTQAGREDLARQAYAEAGYSREHPAKFELLYDTSELHKEIMIAVAAMWQEVLGVTVELNNMEFKAYVDRRLGKQTTEAWRGGLYAAYTDPLPLLEALQTNAPYNDTAYSNAHFDALLEQARHSTDSVERMKLFSEAEETALADFPVAPLFFANADHLVKPYVTGWLPSPRDTYRTRDLSILPH